ncbi:hypothetical protein yberc0001_25730 [Yersinia bercovieri ATCC 43970]|uniref:Uncharacterized protein n=1 Tax=Yersinia bercovieri ATCC 43970 TaxID=349968 RepID=A0ABM9XYS6_YERBE|nr:hypothetical protein yberc0001_25730 [Yersinia bercovieri ATCC 43970]
MDLVISGLSRRWGRDALNAAVSPLEVIDNVPVAERTGGS